MIFFVLFFNMYTCLKKLFTNYAAFTVRTLFTQRTLSAILNKNSFTIHMVQYIKKQANKHSFIGMHFKKRFNHGTFSKNMILIVIHL